MTSFLIKKGAPGVVERTLIRPPSTQLGPITNDERKVIIARSHVAGKYETPIDRISAHEILLERAKQAAQEAEQAEQRAIADEQGLGQNPREFSTGRRYSGSRVLSKRMSTSSTSRRRKSPDSMGEAIGQALVKELAGTTGRRIIRGILGGFFKAR